jgi:hypothetical protein
MAGQAVDRLGEAFSTLIEVASETSAAIFVGVAIAVIFGSLVVVALKAIAGEYVKRWWFGRNPSRREALERELLKKQRELEREGEELAVVRSNITDLLAQNDALWREVLRLRVIVGQDESTTLASARKAKRAGSQRIKKAA